MNINLTTSIHLYSSIKSLLSRLDNSSLFTAMACECQKTNAYVCECSSSLMLSLCFQLSNEMQLSIMNKVKNGELSIEDALNLARRDEKKLLNQKSPAEEVSLSWTELSHFVLRRKAKCLELGDLLHVLSDAPVVDKTWWSVLAVPSFIFTIYSTIPIILHLHDMYMTAASLQLSQFSGRSGDLASRLWVNKSRRF